MTNKELKAKLSAVGVSVKYDEGEYRVCVRGGSEATAYYTDDKDDAYHTGLAMVAQPGTLDGETVEAYFLGGKK